MSDVLVALVSKTQPRTVLELGAETVGLTERLLGAAPDLDVLTVTPDPGRKLLDLAARDARLDLVDAVGLTFLFDNGCPADFVVIDGDHNYWSIYNALHFVHAAWTERGAAGMIALCAPAPSARRDHYRDPDAIPEIGLNPYARGTYGNAAWAVEQGGPKNGVLCATADFLADAPGYELRMIDGGAMLGVLTRRGTEEDAIAEEILAPISAAAWKRAA